MPDRSRCHVSMCQVSVSMCHVSFFPRLVELVHLGATGIIATSIANCRLDAIPTTQPQDQWVPDRSRCQCQLCQCVMCHFFQDW